MSFSEKFSDKARKVLKIAQNEAKQLDQSYTGTDHILLGLLQVPSGIAAQALEALEVSLDDVRAEISKHPQSAEQLDAAGHNPFTPQAKVAFEKAYREAIREKQVYIATGQLLIGLTADPGNAAMEILSDLGVSADAICASVQELADAQSGFPDASQPQDGDDQVKMGVGSGATGSSELGELSDFGRDLTQMARDHRLDPLIGRKDELRRVMQILARRQKNNPLILGDPGVGKTALVEGLASLMASGQVNSDLRGKRIFSLDMASVVAGTKYRGEFEDRLKRIVREVQKSGNIILFIDEIHNLIGAGSAEGTMDAASILKPVLARGEVQVIGATTQEEYRKYIQKDAALERRFQPVYVEEPSQEEAVLILNGLKSYYEDHHHVTYTPAAITAAVRLSARYVQDRFLPDKAIDVLDEAGARTRIGTVRIPKEITLLDDQLVDVTEKKELAIADQQFEEAARLRDQEKRLQEAREQAEKAWDEQLHAESRPVDEAHIQAVVSDMTKIPVSALSEQQAKNLLEAEKVLSRRVIGQSEAISSVARAMRRSHSPLKDPRRPNGSFIFLGPSGVGKTELAKTLAEFLFGSEDALITFDMSEYMEKFAVSKLVGAPPGYIGYDEGGELTKQVRRKPYSVVLFDEIEKAHPDVFDILLQILDEGRLTDGQGRKVDFSNTTIIMTSNVGAKQIATTSPLGFVADRNQAPSHREVKSSVMTELKRKFRPEFLNRVDEIVVFESLNQEELRQIVDIMVRDLRYRMNVVGMDLKLTVAAKDLITKDGVDPVYGARPLRRAIQTLVEDPLSEELLKGTWQPGDIAFVDVDGDRIVITKGHGEVPQVNLNDAKIKSLASGSASRTKGSFASPHISSDSLAQSE